MQNTTKINWDYFWYDGQLELEKEIEADLMWTVLQPRGSMYFNRSDGAIIGNRINYPNTLNREIEMRYDIAMSLARRNLYVSDGHTNGRDQRVAASQTTITFKRPKKGDLDIQIGYFYFKDIANRDNLKFNSLGVVI